MPGLDIKWRNTLSLTSLRERSYRHLTPQYVFHRVRQAAYRKAHPEEPDFTAASIDILSQLLRSSDVGAEWGAGNSTGWLAARTHHITSFETDPAYAKVVNTNLAAQGITNASLQCIEFSYLDDEEEMHKTEWVCSANEIKDDSLDYAVVDSAPRGCLCHLLIPKLRRNGLLILDNANWYIPPPDSLIPKPSASVKVTLGFPGSISPNNICWPKFVEATKDWRRLWTTNGVWATLILFRP